MCSENISLNTLGWSLSLFALKLFDINNFKMLKLYILPIVSITMNILFFLNFNNIIRLGDFSILDYYSTSYLIFGLITGMIIGILLFMRGKEDKSPAQNKFILFMLFVVPIQIIDILLSSIRKDIILSPLLLSVYNLVVINIGIKNLLLLHIKVKQNRNENISSSLQFTQREAQVVDLLLAGHTYKKISDLLCISTATVKTHINRIYKKADIQSRQELKDIYLESSIYI
ncbi:helix-turn-helix transcriptional regulator [Thiospirochaeta perfilievii]|nr:helix-turn-helix transcriptional regulator [Thiospirochaeta perfilievii]